MDLAPSPARPRIFRDVAFCLFVCCCFVLFFLVLTEHVLRLEPGLTEGFSALSSSKHTEIGECGGVCWGDSDRTFPAVRYWYGLLYPRGISPTFYILHNCGQLIKIRVSTACQERKGYMFFLRHYPGHNPTQQE